MPRNVSNHNNYIFFQLFVPRTFHDRRTVAKQVVTHSYRRHQTLTMSSSTLGKRKASESDASGDTKKARADDAFVAIADRVSSKLRPVMTGEDMIEHVKDAADDWLVVDDEEEEEDSDGELEPFDKVTSKASARRFVGVISTDIVDSVGVNAPRLEMVIRWAIEEWLGKKRAKYDADDTDGYHSYESPLGLIDACYRDKLHDYGVLLSDINYNVLQVLRKTAKMDDAFVNDVVGEYKSEYNSVEIKKVVARAVLDEAKVWSSAYADTLMKAIDESELPEEEDDDEDE